MGGNVWQREGKAVSMHGSLWARRTCELQCFWEQGCVKDAVCFICFSSYKCVHLWLYSCKGCTVYCRFRLTASEKHLCMDLFNCLSVEPLRFVYSFVFKGMLYLRKLQQLVICISQHLRYILQGVGTFYKNWQIYSSWIMKTWRPLLNSSLATKACCEDTNVVRLKQLWFDIFLEPTRQKTAAQRARNRKDNFG